jgi:hypothetical protein
VPEQHPEIRARVVGLDEEAPVHVGMAARLVAEQPPHAVDRVVGRRGSAPLPDGRAGDRRHPRGHDPKRLAGGVVVGRRDLHGGNARTAR